VDTRAAVLLVAPDRSYRTGAYVSAAKSLSIPLVIASWGDSDLSVLGSGVRIDSGSEEAALAGIRKAAEQNRFAAVLATDDSTVHLCQKASHMLGLPTNSIEAVSASTNKLRFREYSRAAGFLTPGFRMISLAGSRHLGNETIRFPCVVKPVGLSASRGVIRCNNSSELIAALERVKALLEEESVGERNECLIEDFIPGREFAIEALVSNGELEILAIFDKPDPLDGPFFEETLYVTPPRIDPSTVEQMTRQLERLCRSIGLREGPIHAEVRVNLDGIWFLELAGRTIGGRCGRIVEYQTGFPLEQLVLLNAVRRARPTPRRESASGVMMLPIREGGILRRVEGINRARAVPGVIDVEIDIREGQLLRPWPEGSAYPGFIFASGETSQDVETALRQAEAALRFVIAPTFNVKAH